MLAGCLHLWFCFCFYESFIHKIILVSRFLSFICMSYALKVFKFNAEIVRDLYAVSLLKTLSRLPQSIAFLCLIFFLMFVFNNFPLCAFVIMIYWTSKEVSAVPSLDFELINVFWTSGFDSVSIAFDSLSISRSLP